MNREKAQINKKDAQDVLKIVRAINDSMTLKNYEKNWREIHKKYGINARCKVLIQDFTLYADKRTCYIQEMKKIKKKKDNFRWLTVKYKNYLYRVTYDEATGKFTAQSSFHHYKEERIIIQEA